MRGRNRRGPNPLARSYESNGPDVKVRGTAQHIADRYLQLARDAQSSGDPVTAESYFQHAEHYLRIIAAAQDQMQAQYGYRPRPENGAEDEAEGEEGDAEGFAAPYANAPQSGGFNGQPRQAPFAPNGNGPSETDEQPPMFSPPRERFDNRNQRFGEREGWPRQRGDGRHDNTRRDHHRQDNHRRDPYRRDSGREGPFPSDSSGDPRSSQTRGGPGGGAHGEGAGDQPSFEHRRFQGQQNQGAQGGEGREADRPHRERLERPAHQPREEQVLPSFITAPVRPAPSVAETPSDEPIKARERDEAGAAEPTSPPADAPAPAPRARRGRPRRAAEPSPEVEDGPSAPNDGTNPVGAK
jgi:hypothetical protein